MPTKQSRLDWVDHLRTFIIILVVNAHACGACSNIGNWYYRISPGPRPAVEMVFAIWGAHLQAFFMGLLFFLAGYFADRSLVRRGPKAFLAERALRLGVPTLIFMLIIYPFIMYGLNPWHNVLIPFGKFYAHYLSSGYFLVCTGPLWFSFALLLFCFDLVVARMIRPVTTGYRAQYEGAPRLKMTSLLGVGLALGFASFLVRIWLPIGVAVFGFAPCFFPQYVGVFCLGIAVSRRNALQALAGSPVAAQALRLGLVGGPISLGLVGLMVGLPTSVGFYSFMGGVSLPGFAYALWEQLTGVCIGLGLMSWFSQHLNRETPFLRWLADRSFGVYVFHAPILIAFTMLFQHLHAIRFVLAALLTIVTLVASYLFADVIRRLPGLRTIF